MVKIGIFDSGIGGITVLTELCKRLKGVSYFYLGDTAHLPYGAKSPSQVQKLSVECAQVLKKKKVDALIVACNTASSLALEAVRAMMHPIPVFGVVHPGVQAALSALEGMKSGDFEIPLLVLATRATTRSQAYALAFEKEIRFCPQLKLGRFPVLEQPCSVLVPLIEEGWIDHPVLHQTVAEYVRPHLMRYSTGVALLACTHYPWIHSAFEKALPGWRIVNSAQAVAQSLVQSDLFGGSIVSENDQNQIEWSFTDPDVVPEFAKQIIYNQPFSLCL